MNSVKPFLKWAGGKRWFVSRYSQLFDRDYKRYYEPFIGSGAVFFSLCPVKSFLSDINNELIITYKTIRDDPKSVWDLLQLHLLMHSKEYYYKVRSQQPKSPACIAARLIYLNKTCFNGLYRVNRNGIFNVPIGSKKEILLSYSDFIASSIALKNSKISCTDFENTIKNTSYGDIVYVDPPYTVKHNSNNFIKYNECLFTWQDQIRLSIALNNAAKNGACILLSNADHSCIKELYNDKKWIHLKAERFSRLASNVLHRKTISEVIISNYLDNELNQLDTPRT